MEYGLIGERLGHSYSEVIHRAFGAYDYTLHSLPPDELEHFFQTSNFRGINVTIPYKKSVIPFCAELSETAQKIGSVNTIVRRPDGSLYGDNTDYFGFVAMARLAGIDFTGKRVAILGSGGTSLTAQAVTADAGASAVTVVSRKGPVTCDHLGVAAQADVVINTTPVGMYPNNDASPVPLERFPNCSGVLDVIYNPLRTRLLSAAREAGIPHAGGLYMLTAQAARAYEVFRNEPMPDNILQSVYHRLTADVSNLVLVGMPGCGKSTVGRMLAERLNRPFVDLDEVVAGQAGKTVPEIFAQEGEAAFRRMEAAAASETGKQKGLVIACGGGAILTAENRAALRQNGRVYWLQRAIGQLETSGRPLSTGLDALFALARQREPLYRLASDCIIDNNGLPETTVQQILEDFNESIGD